MWEDVSIILQFIIYTIRHTYKLNDSMFVTAKKCGIRKIMQEYTLKLLVIIFQLSIFSFKPFVFQVF